MENLNYLTIIIATIVSFGIGMFWYSKKAFGIKWLSYQRFSSNEIKESDRGITGPIILALILEFMLVGAFNYALLMTGKNPYCIAALFVIGIMFPIMAGGTLWEKRPAGILWINFFYRVVSFTTVAIIFDYLV